MAGRVARILAGGSPQRQRYHVPVPFAGVRYPQRGPSLAHMDRGCRAVGCHRLYLQADLSNAHPTIYSALGPDQPAIVRYVREREVVLREVTE